MKYIIFKRKRKGALAFLFSLWVSSVSNGAKMALKTSRVKTKQERNSR